MEWILIVAVPTLVVYVAQRLLRGHNSPVVRRTVRGQPVTIAVSRHTGRERTEIRVPLRRGVSLSPAAAAALMATLSERGEAPAHPRADPSQREKPLAAAVTATLSELGERALSLERGELVYRLERQPFDPSVLEAEAERMVELASRFSVTDEQVREQLVRDAFDRRLPAAVRLRRLFLLQDHFRGSAEAAEASRRALADRDPDIRFLGASYLDARDVLEALAADDSLDDPLRVRSVRHLARSLPPSDVGPILERLLSSRSTAVQWEVLGEVTRLSYRPAAPEIASLAEGADPAMARAIAEALAKLCDPAAEPALVRLLAHEEEGVRLAAARALGDVGTPAAVEPLLALTGGFFDSGLKQAAREAIERIQSRLKTADAGQLSIAEVAPEQGALSVTLPSSGELSPADD